MKKTIYVIAGPTATGKSDFSIKLAKKINGVIINSDSMQVYKNLQILTARPSPSETKNIPHYMYGYIDGNATTLTSGVMMQLILFIRPLKTILHRY